MCTNTLLYFNRGDRSVSNSAPHSVFELVTEGEGDTGTISERPAEQHTSVTTAFKVN